MALTMLDKAAEKKEKSQWPAAIAAEFEREAKNPNPCVGSTLLSENERTRVWIIRLAPGERIGFHRHVLDYFWTSVSGGHGRQHVHDGSTVEYTYQPGETRHESLRQGRVQGARSGKSRRQGTRVHDRRVQGQRQPADAAARRRAPASCCLSGLYRRARLATRGGRCRVGPLSACRSSTSQAAAHPAHCRAMPACRAMRAGPPRGETKIIVSEGRKTGYSSCRSRRLDSASARFEMTTN